MKKTWIYLLGITLSLGFTACGDAATETESETPATEEMEVTDEMEDSTDMEENSDMEAENTEANATPAPDKTATAATPKATINKKAVATNTSEMASDDAPVAVEQPKKAVTAVSND